jgi:hypothetical protein
VLDARLETSGVSIHRHDHCQVWRTPWIVEKPQSFCADKRGDLKLHVPDVDGHEFDGYRSRRNRPVIELLEHGGDRLVVQQSALARAQDREHGWS